MSAPVWLELVCRRCATEEAGRFSLNGRIPLREMKKDALRMGWVYDSKTEDWFCRTCKKDRERHDED